MYSLSKRCYIKDVLPTYWVSFSRITSPMIWQPSLSRLHNYNSFFHIPLAAAWLNDIASICTLKKWMCNKQFFLGLSSTINNKSRVIGSLLPQLHTDKSLLYFYYTYTYISLSLLYYVAAPTITTRLSLLSKFESQFPTYLHFRTKCPPSSSYPHTVGI